MTDFYSRNYGRTSHNKGRLKQLRALFFALNEGGPVLDVGCGDGQLTNYLRSKGMSVEGCDISEPAVDAAKRDGLRAWVCGEYDLRADRRYASIVCNDVIEHVVDTGRFLRELHDTLRPDGVLVIGTPNLASLANRVKLLFGRTPTYFEGHYADGRAGHLRLYTPQALKETLEACGFAVTNFTCNHVYLPGFKHRTIPFLGTIAPGLGELIMMTARKRERGEKLDGR